MELVLASKSPRRIEILRNVGYDFKVTPADFDEGTVDLTVDPVLGVKQLAKGKASAVFNTLPETSKISTVVLGADTIVVCDGEVMLKPKDELDAHRMLKRLSGDTHQVYTAVSLITASETKTFVEKTDVYFYDLSDEEIDAYIKTGEPMDKAGAYGIQGKGCFLVKKIDGDYFNVVGLPISSVMRQLKNIGLD
ncbi:MAG: septum formation inhibitor Maf [Oscillospiraceae bacterium]|nr:septum formation inhibitor Maf [Candidatus Limimonas coprohippi]